MSKTFVEYAIENVTEERNFTTIINELMEEEWSVGYMDRGMGHGSYAVVLVDSKGKKEVPGLFDDLETLTEEEMEIVREESRKIQKTVLVAKCDLREIAEDIVENHNKSLSKE